MGFVTSIELGLVATRHLKWWMTFVILLVHGWGFFDALIRFPLVPDFESCFTLKQFLLFGVNIVSSALGFIDISASRMWFFAVLLVNIAVLPLIYFLALPVDDSAQNQRLAAHDVVNVDIAIRMVRFAGSLEQQREFLRTCRRRFRGAVIGVAQRSPR